MRYSMLAGVLALGLISGAAIAAESYVGGAVMRSDDGYLTDANGMTLYSFDKDTEGVSTCYEQCAINWPPALAEEGATAEGDFTLVERTDGTMQWAYKGMPLYLWKDDAAVGDTTGDGVGGVWHLVTD
jgi:predicted lipoprotein with Yx(FWY)xxD motif